MAKRDRDELSAVAWKMFEKTGNPAYYSLYKKISGTDGKKR